jgi:hypothetical protein
MRIVEEELEKVTLKIYDIKCDIMDCEDCQSKYNTEDCPKAYADDVREGLKLLRLNMDNCYGIYRRIEK